MRKIQGRIANPIIYKTINTINNKIYVGKDLYNNPKYMGSGKVLKQAFRKYGKENFKKEIIEFCKTENHMNNREKFWIKKLNSFTPNGYNINEGGKGGDTFSHKSEEEKEKIKQKQRDKATGKRASLKTRMILAKLSRDRVWSEKSCKRMSDLKIAYWKSEEAHKEMSDRKIRYWAVKRENIAAKRSKTPSKFFIYGISKRP